MWQKKYMIWVALKSPLVTQLEPAHQTRCRSCVFVLISGSGSESSRIEERINNLTGTSLANQLKDKEQAFDAKFEKIFNLAEKIFDDDFGRIAELVEGGCPW